MNKKQQIKELQNRVDTLEFEMATMKRERCEQGRHPNAVFYEAQSICGACEHSKSFIRFYCPDCRETIQKDIPAELQGKLDLLGLQMCG